MSTARYMSDADRLPEEPSLRTSMSRLVEAMKVNQNAPGDAQLRILRHNRNLGGRDVAAINRVILDGRIQQFIRSPACDIVLVGAYFDHGRMTKNMTTLTVAAAFLLQALQKLPDSHISLGFFCGQRNPESEDVAGPTGLLRTLIVLLVLELFHRGNVDITEEIRFPGVYNELPNISFGELCRIFIRLVRTLPLESKIFCIIDNIHVYEQNYSSDLGQLLECFDYLVNHGDETKVVFKVFLTSSVKWRVFEKMDDSRYKVTVRL